MLKLCVWNNNINNNNINNKNNISLIDIAVFNNQSMTPDSFKDLWGKPLEFHGERDFTFFF